MARISKVTNKDSEKRTKQEPFAAVHYDGSYGAASMVLNLIGVDNLSLSKEDRRKGMDDLIDGMMDDNSNLHVPEIMENAEEKLISNRKLTLHVDSWIVLEINPETEWIEVVFYTDQQFNAKYEVVK